MEEQLKLFEYTGEEIAQFELDLFDRIEKIKSIINKHGEENFYIAFSGGKDSTILHYLIDMALPNNKIPRVFSNTGLDYIDIVKFVKQMASTDERFHIVVAGKNIPKTLEKVGYPFKSKEHAHKVYLYKTKGQRSPSVLKYKEKYCPKILKYQYTDDFKLFISSQCCHEFKTGVGDDWAKEHGKTMKITGMRRKEGGRRSHIACVAYKKRGKQVNLYLFHPLAPIDDKWEDWFIKKFNIKLCVLYYPPYDFKRTGCVGCPDNIEIQEYLDKLKRLLPFEYKRAWLYFGKVYKEYRRIGYRMRKEGS